MENIKSRELLPEAAPFALWAIFFSPLATIESLSRRPRWFIPLLVAGIYSTAVSYYVIARFGFAALVAKSAQASSQLDPDMVLQHALANKTQIIVVQSISTFLGAFATSSLIALVLWLLVILVGGDAVFKKVLALTAHVALFTAAVRETMLAVTVTLNSDLNSFNFNNPLATNLAFFVHSSSRFTARVFSALDIVTIATVVLLALGLTRVSKRVSPTAAWLAVLIPWAIYVVGGAWFTLT